MLFSQQKGKNRGNRSGSSERSPRAGGGIRNRLKQKELVEEIDDGNYEVVEPSSPELGLETPLSVVGGNDEHSRKDVTGDALNDRSPKEHGLDTDTDDKEQARIPNAYSDIEQETDSEPEGPIIFGHRTACHVWDEEVVVKPKKSAKPKTSKRFGSKSFLGTVYRILKEKSTAAVDDIDEDNKEPSDTQSDIDDETNESKNNNSSPKEEEESMNEPANDNHRSEPESDRTGQNSRGNSEYDPTDADQRAHDGNEDGGSSSEDSEETMAWREEKEREERQEERRRHLEEQRQLMYQLQEQEWRHQRQMQRQEFQERRRRPVSDVDILHLTFLQLRADD